jgi:hypothetical protein
MMNERGLSLDHTTIYRWVQAYAPELEKRIRPHLRLTSDSYRVDETYINRTIKGYEAMNMIRKGQIEGVGRKDMLGQVGFVVGLFRIAA